MTTEPNCYVENSRDERFLNILADKNANIDELNYLMKRFDSFTTREIEKFYAIAFAEEPKSMAELINLSFNLHCYSLINNFNDFNKLGKDLYLTEKMAVAAEELEKLDTLNKVSDKFMEMDGDVEYFERLMDHINHLTIDEFLLLADSMYEFELFDGIKDVESYGRYMISESGHFEYDDNLEEYIDFKRYGQIKMANELGAFSDKGYIVYHGYNQKLSNILSENLGIEIPKTKEQKTMKLYMPLTVRTYEVENDYGFSESLNEPLELGNYEIASYIDEILDAIERDRLPDEIHRGLMHYYNEHDSVNGKVEKYEFSVEMVGDELLGVAILTLNDDLTMQELEKIKGNITGQASDGWGEGFEQREIKTDIGDIYISFWNSGKDWFIKSAEEMGITENQIMGGIKFE
ncbi:protein of unknown function [Tissierella praeacuta DSM 18095]|uniref:Antirestriction protein (ArdA) n=1 Tax=Tissierella praeacuta DSM 18095 TaxID=1123404 RepID=A0A1M4YQP8_9FIRM|nr:antirestriction protein ArdA [Tissierella praeacuta]SHF08013.1 protein of unknown function [Tissierella praeacuta DSM 18095]SUP02436.1 Antirestriction protein (ArdA) [Tissierella praeacuta]